MKVLLVNGSAHSHGATFTALNEVAVHLQKNGVDTEVFHIGTKPVHGCVDCGKCRETMRCAFTDDGVNECIGKMAVCDGLVLGSPVYYAGPNGALCAFLDRMFFAGSSAFAYKPAAAVVNLRRGGASASFDRLNKYFTISSMPVVSSQYWNMTHGFEPDEVRQDPEGLQTMRVLADNMAWLLKCIDCAKGKVPYPTREPHIFTNFIR